MKRCLACQRGFEGRDWRCPVCGFVPGWILGFPAFATELTAQEIGFDAARYEALAEVEARHFWFQSRVELIIWALGHHFAHARSVLEIGCGTGHVMAAIARADPTLRIAGSEAHSAGLAFAARRAPAAELLQMDARQIPYRDEFDVVGAFDVIEHIREDAQVLREMFAACRPGGGIVLTVPQHEWLWSYRDEFARHQRRYRRKDLLAKIAGAGFERPWTTSFVTLLLPTMAASRARQRLPEGFDPSRELRVGRVANRVLGAVMAAERRMIAAGLSLPVGGSLLAVAHKPARSA
ncbi:MAG: class I SAM-dependent methyltransferase [Burkholderiales bacterium]